MTDYWVNDQQGRHFFAVSTPFTSGLLKMLKSEIIPRLLREVPHQPTENELRENPHLHRFTMVFDREGYSPEFFANMWTSRIACQTYHKHPKEDWPTSEFEEVEVSMPGGNKMKMRLAERGVLLGGIIWLREIRYLGETGHQTSVFSTDYISDAGQIAVHMFTRWCQENFFRYMMEHYHLDRLIDYEMVKPDETVDVVNPVHRKLVSQIRSVAAKKVRKQVEFCNLTLQEPSNSKEVERYEMQKATVLDYMNQMEKELDELKQKRKQTEKHIAFVDLPEEDKFQQLSPTRKQFMDTIRMISYWAETAMVS
ncbi:MAG: hypothetical protein GY847_00700, partial [Proteobacteria bacterium]|nr:hypothetical protein [Pseudomonadota bacterium]